MNIDRILFLRTDDYINSDGSYMEANRKNLRVDPEKTRRRRLIEQIKEDRAASEAMRDVWE